jgi:glycerol-3-phosphate dehydrogenase (NAD(P)+)
MKLAVLGAGAWGTALAVTLSAAHQVTLWSRDAEQCRRMHSARINARYLPDVALPADLQITSDLDTALAQCECTIVAVTLAGLRNTLRTLARSSRPIPVIWLCKGLEADSAKLPHQVAAEELPVSAPRGMLSGPSFAQEVARGIPAAVTLASDDAAFSARMARELHTLRFRVYSSQDVIGVEVGAAAKNVIAIAAGISDGLGFGESARAALITRGLAEVTRLGLRLGARSETLMGLSGVGDLILTCTGTLSRNRRVGLRLASGQALPDILRELGHVAEGVHSAPELRKTARSAQADTPIIEAVCDVLYAGLAPLAAVDQLLRRDPKPEHRT